MSNTIFRYLIFAVICATILFFDVPVRVVGVVNLASLLVLGNGIKRKQGKFLSPFLLMAVCIYIFHCGHLWLALFSFSPTDLLGEFGVRYRVSDVGYIIGVYKEITWMLITFMAVGVLAVKPISSEKVCSGNETYIISNLFFVAFYVLYVIAFYFDYERALSVASSSYGEGYRYTSSISSYITTLVDILLLFFMYIYRNNPNQFRKFVILQLIRILFIIFFVGNRGTSVINLLLTFFMISTYSYISNDTKKIRNILFFLFVFLIIAMPFVSSTRNASNITGVSQFLQFNNPIENFLDEFGGTAQNVFMSKEYCINHVPYYGIQIFATTLSILPWSSIFWGDLIAKYVSVGGFFNLYYNIEGLGGSMLSQLYINFGNSIFLYISIILSALLTSSVSNKLMRRNSDIYSTLLFLCLFSGLLTWVRGEWYDVVGAIKMGLYVILIIYIFKKSILIKK